jgi:hypothetical protein
MLFLCTLVSFGTTINVLEGWRFAISRSDSNGQKQGDGNSSLKAVSLDGKEVVRKEVDLPGHYGGVAFLAHFIPWCQLLWAVIWY